MEPHMRCARPLPADNPGTPPASDEDEVVDSSDEEQPSENGSSSRTKTPQTNMKQIWLLTYGASNPYITPEMLKKFFKTKIEVDECHSTKDRAMTVTYLNLDKRVRQSSIEKFMKEANEKQGIVQNPTAGYESIASISKKDTPIQEHIGFKLLLKHFISKDPAFVPWTDGEPVLKRGLIFEAATDKPKKQPPRVRKNSVSKANEQLRAKVTELSTLVTQKDAKISTLRTEKAALKRKIQELERFRTEALLAESAAQKRQLREFEHAQFQHD
jgi:hypothetical protein